MNVENLKIDGVRQIERMNDMILDVKQAIEERINVGNFDESIRPVTVNLSTVMRICMLVGLSDKGKRNVDEVNKIHISSSAVPYTATFFTKANVRSVFEALIKLRYCDVDAEWSSNAFVSKVLGAEMLRGRDILLKEGGIDEWLHYSPMRGGKMVSEIPELNLAIGKYEDGMDAALDINSRAISNTQILVAGTTGSGKSNLLAVLINQIRMASSDTHYPVSSTTRASSPTLPMPLG